MAQAFMAQHDKHQGIKKAHVTATFPLSDELAAQLQEIVRKMTPAKQIELDRHIDPTLLGGYVLQVEDKRLDQSLRKRLSVISEQLLIKDY
ncbi:MAG: F0F1 ATP synthase subunit delta, partial [Bacteroidota bacterium]